MSARRRLAVFWVAVLPLLVGCAGNLPKVISGFDEVSQEMDVIAVMPPHFSLGEIGAFTAQTLSEMNHDIENEIKASMEALIAESSYDQASLDLDDSTLAADPDMRKALYESVQEIGRISEIMGETEGREIDVDYTADLDYFADIADADYFLFVLGSGWFKTTGAKVKAAAAGIVLGAIFGGTPTSEPGCATSIETVLVDAQLGKIIWYNTVSITDLDPRKPRELLKTTQVAMKPLLGKSNLKGDKSRDNELIDKYKNRMIDEEKTAP